MIHLNLDFSACPPNCCLPHFPTQILHLMQFPFALVLSLPMPLSFAHYFSSSRLLTSFLCPCFTRVPSSPVSGLAWEATWESEAHHRLGTRFRGSEQDAIQCVQTQSHRHGLCPLGPFNPGASTQLSSEPSLPPRDKLHGGQDILEQPLGTKCFVWEQSWSPFLPH